LLQKISHHPASGKRPLKVQFVDSLHQLKVRLENLDRPVIGRRSRQPQQHALSSYGNLGLAVNHLFALSSPALISAFSKKSFSRLSCPILACMRWISGPFSFSGFSPNAMAAFSWSCRFQSVIWLGCTSNCSASSAIVLSPFRAARATFALNTEL
jgi:hypothetical protein